MEIKEKRNNHAKIRQIKATILKTNETMYFNCKNQASKYFNCSPAMVYMVCEGKAPNFHNTVKFEYSDDENVEVYIIPRKQMKTKFTEDEKKMKFRANAKKYYEEHKTDEKLKLRTRKNAHDYYHRVVKGETI